MSDRICTIDGCDRRRYSRDWCKAHYSRWQRHGDPLGGGTRHKPRNVPCSVEACYELAQRQGLCWGHYGRLRDHGDVMADVPVQRRDSSVEPDRWPAIQIEHAWQPPGDVSVPCREHFPEVFTGRDNARLAARICHGCPVISDCYAAAIRQRDWGTWGGVYFEEGRPISTRSLRATGESA